MKKEFDLFGLFYDHAISFPNDIMIYTPSGAITYGEVLGLVDYYAREISSVTGEKSTRIMLYLEHSYKIIVSILAVLKTGNSYVPIRKEETLTNLYEIAMYCESDLVISDSVLPDEFRQIDFSGSPTSVCDSIHANHYLYHPKDEVYVLFTSGSTGKPKGCSVTHGNLCYILSNMLEISAAEQGDVFCFSTPYTFDVSVTEIYSFAFGVPILAVDLSQYDCFKNLPQIMSEYKVTHFALSPSVLKNLIESYTEEQFRMFSSSLKCVMVAGEAFKEKILEAWELHNWHFRLLNLYGPTEATVYATQYEFHHGESLEGGIPIGSVKSYAQNCLRLW